VAAYAKDSLFALISIPLQQAYLFDTVYVHMCVSLGKSRLHFYTLALSVSLRRVRLYEQLLTTSYVPHCNAGLVLHDEWQVQLKMH
jgi:hypothetical protein